MGWWVECHNLLCLQRPKSAIELAGKGIAYYQSPLILTELFQHNLINVSYLTACWT